MAVGIRRCDVNKMFTALLQSVLPDVKKVTVQRGHIDGYEVRATLKGKSSVTVSGEPDIVMKTLLKELGYG